VPRGPSALRANVPARWAVAEAALNASWAFLEAAVAASLVAGDDDEAARRRGAVVRSARTLRSAELRILPAFCLLLCRKGKRRGRLAVVVVVVVRCGVAPKFPVGKSARELPWHFPTYYLPPYPHRTPRAEKNITAEQNTDNFCISTPWTFIHFSPRTFFAALRTIRYDHSEV
jgi:hypothetical protein